MARNNLSIVKRAPQKMTNVPPRERLKALRQRSGMSGSEIARQMGYSYPTGYFRYEDHEKQGDKPIPYRVVKDLIPILRGRGSPPITIDELLAISDARSLPSIVGNKGSISAAFETYNPGLAIRHRIEGGVFLESDDLPKKNFGSSPILPSIEYPAEMQSAAIVACDNPDGWPRRGSILHVVAPEQVAAGRMRGKLAVVEVARGGSGLAEVLVGRLLKQEDDEWMCSLPDREDRPVRVLGITIAVYSPEF